MKNIRLSVVLFLLAAVSFAVPASAHQVKWSAETEKLADDLYRVVVTADIDKGWHMYDLGPYESGPNPTVIAFSAEGAAADGKMEVLTAPHRYHDDVYGCEIGTYEGQAKFAQNFRLTAGNESAKVKINVEWMVCDDESCMPPDDAELTVEIGAAAAAEEPAVETVAADTKAAVAPVKDAAGSGSLWALIIEAILWGFAALLTPCVFPMVPMTVSYFLKGEGGPARGHYTAYARGGRRRRDGRHIQLAGYALAAQYHILYSIYGIRGIVLRSIRDYDALVVGQQERLEGRHKRFGRHILPRADAGISVVLLHGSDCRFGAD